MLSLKQQRVNRLIDVVFSVFGIFMSIIPMLILVLLSSISTRSFGFFFQERVGKHAEIFILYKIKTMRVLKNGEISLTWFGRFLRKTKLDEIPQLFNVLFGDMSIVGPRPDIQGYADKLVGENRILLSVRPGLTGPATLLFFDEEEILKKKDDPLSYNDTVLWPQKVEINKKYVEDWSLLQDFKYMMETSKIFFQRKR